MKNFVSEGKTITATVAADIASGVGLLIGGILGVACKDYKNGDTNCEFAVEGVFTLPKLSTDTLVKGQKLWWDEGNKRLTEIASTLEPCAIAWEVAGNGVATVAAKLWPMTKDTIE